MKFRWNKQRNARVIEFTPEELGTLTIALEIARYRTGDKDITKLNEDVRKMISGE